ncbi:MAG: very short patch repair endonuclease [Nitrospinales bacterium]
MDTLTPSQRKMTMTRVKAKDTGPEMKVRRLIHNNGYRYRLHRKDLPGKPDLVFPGSKKIIFVHGCFWHRHNCSAGRKKPKSNKEYWNLKLSRNKARDKKNCTALKNLGWSVLVIWECETRDRDYLKNELINYLQVKK